MENITKSVDQVIDQLKSGQMAVLIQDMDKKQQNRGYLFQPAASATPSSLNRISRMTGGISYLALDWHIFKKLQLPIQPGVAATDIDGDGEVDYTVGINIRDSRNRGGGSANDKFMTLNKVISRDMKGDEFSPNGQLFPLSASLGGVLERSAFTDTTVDIAKMCDAPGAAVVSDILNDEGDPANVTELDQFAKAHSLPILRSSEFLSYYHERHKDIKTVSRGYIDTFAGRYPSTIVTDYRGNQNVVIQSSETLDSAQPLNVIVHEANPVQDIQTLGKRGINDDRYYKDLNIFSNLDNAVYVVLCPRYEKHALQGANETFEGIEDTDVPFRQNLYKVASIASRLGAQKINVFSREAQPIEGRFFDVEVNEVIGVTDDMTLPPPPGVGRLKAGDAKRALPGKGKAAALPAGKGDNGLVGQIAAGIGAAGALASGTAGGLVEKASDFAEDLVDSISDAAESAFGDDKIKGKVAAAKKDVKSFIDARRDDAFRVPSRRGSQLQSESFSLMSLISAVLEENQDQIAAHRLEIFFKKGQEDVNVLGDFGALKESLDHILDNAIRYTPKKEGLLGFDIQKDGGNVVLGIYDNGTGIERAELDSLLKDVFSSKEPGEFKDKLTEGLNVSRQMLEKMNGKLDIRSELGSGSQFFITLPAA